MKTQWIWLLALCTVAAHAQTNETSNTTTRLPDIIVTARADSMIYVAESASEGTIGSKELQERPWLRVAEVVEAVPGVIATQHAGGGKANQYFLRGFNLDHGTDFSTTLNGVPWNLPTHGHGQGYTDLNPLIPELVVGAEYKKGPYFADEGDFSSAGAVNIDYVNELPEGLASITAGDQGYQRGLVADSLNLNDGTLLYGVEFAHDDGPWEQPDDFQKFNSVVRYSRGDADHGFSTTFMGYHGTWGSSDQIAQRAVESGYVDYFGSLDDTTGGNSERYVLIGEIHSGTVDSMTRALGYIEYYDLDLFSDFTYYLDDPVNGDQFEQTDERYIQGATLSHEYMDRIAQFDTDSTVGLDLRNDIIDNGLFHTKDRAVLSTTLDDHVIQTSLSPWVQTKEVWTEWFRTTTGLRADFYHFDVDSDDNDNDGTEDDGIVSPKLCLIFGPWVKTEVYVNGGLGFHSNDGRGTTLDDDPSTPEPDDGERVDPLVRTEGAEVGVRTEAIEGLNSSIALWILDIDSELVFIGDAGNTEAGRPSRRHGIEFANFYSLTRWLTVDLDYAICQAQFRDDDPAGDEIPGSIEDSIAAGMTLRNLHDFFGSVRLRYFGPRPLIEDGSVESSSTTLVNLQVGYHINRTWTTSLEVFNLFDEKDSDIEYYYVSRLPGEPEEGVADIHYHPAEPLNARIQLTAHF